jgi:hypothetical protein
VLCSRSWPIHARLPGLLQRRIWDTRPGQSPKLFSTTSFHSSPQALRRPTLTGHYYLQACLFSLSPVFLGAKLAYGRHTSPGLPSSATRPPAQGLRQASWLLSVRPERPKASVPLLSCYTKPRESPSVAITNAPHALLNGLRIFIIRPRRLRNPVIASAPQRYPSSPVLTPLVSISHG